MLDGACDFRADVDMKLELLHVSKTYKTRNREVLALADISFTVSPREFVCLVGPSGCGKSTLLNIFAGLERPSSGSAFSNGGEISEPDPSRLLLFQDPTLFPWLTVQLNVEFGLKMKGVPSQRRSAEATQLLKMVHLEQFGNVWVHELSGGMRQRVALARALAVEPKVLLMDEPFGSLDAITRDRLHIELQEIWSKTGKTVIFVTHNVREAVVLGDRVLVFSARPGRLVAEHRIDLPRPRLIEDIGTVNLARRVMADLKSEGNLNGEKPCLNP
jgi:NitT/TauT family transport system ATP-binding protein